MNHKFLKRTRHEGQRFDGHVFNKKQMRLRRILSNITRISFGYRMAKPFDNEAERVLLKLHRRYRAISFERNSIIFSSSCLGSLFNAAAP